VDTATVDQKAAVPVGSPDVVRARRSRRTRHRLLIVGVILAAAIGFLLYKGLTSAIVYFKTADQAVADRGQLGNSTFQIEGVVVARSVHSAGSSAVDFAIRSNGVTVAVHNTGSPPALFQANIPVVLVGHFIGGSDRFSSDEILVKHSNSYIAAHPSRVRAPNGSTR